MSTIRRQDRLFNSNGRRHYRRHYSMTEVRVGAVILVCLVAVGGWVAYRGAHGDPELFSSGESLLKPATANAVASPFPSDLAGTGWSAGPVSVFGYDDLYKKVNGREDHYKSFGFVKLYFASLAADNVENTHIDIELFDQGSSANAVGVYASERQPGADVTVGPNGLSHIARNGLFMTQGRHYARVIGSDETPLITSALASIAEQLRTALPASPLPWGLRVFAAAGITSDPGKVSYFPKNAFSFGFASNVYAATVGEQQTQVFIAHRDAPADAATWAQNFMKAFADFGEPQRSQRSNRSWLKHEFLSTFSGAVSVGRWVVGVREAKTIDEADQLLTKISEGVQSIPADSLDIPKAAPLEPETATPEKSYDPEALER